MATMKAKQAAKKAGTVSVTLTEKAKPNHSTLWTVMFGHGETAGIGARAKLDAALDFQRLVKDGTIDVSTDELRKAAIEDATSGYDAGMAKALNRALSNSDSLKSMRTDFGTFIRADVLTHGADAYKLIADAVKGKKSTEVKTDQFQQHCAVNRAVDKAKGVPSKATIAEKLAKKADPELSPADLAKAELKKLKAIADAILKLKAGVSKANRALILDLASQITVPA